MLLSLNDLDYIKHNPHVCILRTYNCCKPVCVLITVANYINNFRPFLNILLHTVSPFLASDDNLCKQSGHRKGQIKRWP